jgi:2-keto-4-pentenoate hydratase
MDDAICIQRRNGERLLASHGRIVGYKAGLTSQAAQQQFGFDRPLMGVLHERMLLADGARVPADYGARPIFEADMLLSVKSEAINAAKTRTEALAALDQVIAFIELPDLVLAPGQALSGPIIQAINVGARLGVVGSRVPVQATPAFEAALASMQIVMRDTAGAEVMRAPGAAVLGHPLDVVLFVADTLRQRGAKLAAGDLISLGTFGRAQPPRAGVAVTVSYEGLPGGTPIARVAFE